MKKIILLGGELACGKSTYADILGCTLGIMVIHKDRLKEILGARLSANSREENLLLSAVCFDLEAYVMEQSKAPVVIESNFKAHELLALQPLLSMDDCRVLSLRFTGDDRVLHERYLRRDAQRNPIHKSRDLSRLNDFIAAQAELKEAVYPGEVIEVDATTFAYQEDLVLLNRVQMFLDSSVGESDNTVYNGSRDRGKDGLAR